MATLEHGQKTPVEVPIESSSCGDDLASELIACGDSRHTGSDEGSCGCFFFQRPVPEMVNRYLADSGLEWYRIAINLAADRVDPIYRAIASRMPDGQLLLGSGSDIVCVVLGLPKQDCGPLAEINTLMDPELEFVDLFKDLHDVEVPEYRGRPPAKVDTVYINGESGFDLRLMVSNAAQSRGILNGSSGCLRNPLKLDAIAVVSAEREAALYFRTVDDYVRFIERKLSLPDISGNSIEEWLHSAPLDEIQQRGVYILQYAATVWERARDIGWTFDPAALGFLRKLAQIITSEQKETVRAWTRSNFSSSWLGERDLGDTFAFLGLDRTDSVRI